MRYIRLYRFQPSTQPPSEIRQMYPWFQEELNRSSVQPVASYEISNEQLAHGNETYFPWAQRVFLGLSLLKNAFLRFKNRLS